MITTEDIADAERRYRSLEPVFAAHRKIAQAKTIGEQLLAIWECSILHASTEVDAIDLDGLARIFVTEARRAKLPVRLNFAFILEMVKDAYDEVWAARGHA